MVLANPCVWFKKDGADNGHAPLHLNARMPLADEPQRATPLPFSAAADRNKAVILERLGGLLDAAAQVLEIASGTGQHAAHFAHARPLWQWQPTELQGQALAAISARCNGLANVRAPVQLDVMQHPWPLGGQTFDAVFCANVLHIAPWATCAALLHGANEHLRPGGLLLLYGPFLVEGVVTAASNLAFDRDLRARNGEWGVRHLSAVVQEAARWQLQWQQRLDMPANNCLLVFRRATRA